MINPKNRMLFVNYWSIHLREGEGQLSHFLSKLLSVRFSKQIKKVFHTSGDVEESPSNFFLFPLRFSMTDLVAKIVSVVLPTVRCENGLWSEFIVGFCNITCNLSSSCISCWKVVNCSSFDKLRALGIFDVASF